jgi:hypothetical protein
MINTTVVVGLVLAALGLTTLISVAALSAVDRLCHCVPWP